MTILVVAPNPAGSGEAITANAVARGLAQKGCEVRVFAHPFAAAFFDAGLAVDRFGAGEADTAARWRKLLGEARPAIVLFADHALLPLAAHGRALLTPDSQQALDESGAALVTFDHLGLGQGPFTIGFGPPHLDPFPASIAALPQGMRRLLPCPVQSPAPVAGRRGEPCRYGPPITPLPAARRDAVRARFTRSNAERLVLHATPGWSLGYCRRHGLPQPAFLGRILDLVFAGMPGPVTVVCVSAGEELQDRSTGDLRILRLPALPADEYDELLRASDLMFTDNRVSVGLGKAAAAGVAAAALRNSHRLPEIVERGGEPAALALALDAARPGAVFPFEVFPLWSRADVEQLGVFRENLLNDCVESVELFGGDATRRALADLLWSRERQAALRGAQSAYADAIRRLPAGDDLVLSPSDVPAAR